MNTTHLPPQTVLYNQDYQVWLETVIKQLHAKEFERVDWENLLEELEGLAARDRRELENRLIVLLMHLLKYQYQPERRSSSWRRTIVEQRQQIESLLNNSPSLKPYYLEIFFECYSKAIKAACIETLLPLKTFPGVASFSPEDAINLDFIFSLVNQEEI